MNYEDLSKGIRDLMLEEMEADLKQGRLYMSKRLTPSGLAAWPDLLRRAITSGNDESLALEIRTGHYLEHFELRNTRYGVSRARVPRTAPETLAEGEFNRFYCRGVCLEAMGRHPDGYVEVYRAKMVRNPRPESEMQIGRSVDAQSLLSDLRKNIGVDTALGVPAGPNSGLSIRHGGQRLC